MADCGWARECSGASEWSEDVGCSVCACEVVDSPTQRNQPCALAAWPTWRPPQARKEGFASEFRPRGVGIFGGVPQIVNHGRDLDTQLGEAGACHSAAFISRLRTGHLDLIRL